ncbi:unnamed protein product [Periconia digitata]|uniref:Dienelactone hydrolase domain-containing protein n=1 Tax=Periconia digitata TaxID=1303443 RepID=A0A9W4XPU4_9PLEO|nr:unnamed protein product [Periconia digitata]
MSTKATQSEACCNTPAVVSKGYEPKGSYITVDGLKTYATGSQSKRGILVIYDIFGFFPQTLQGADILSTSSTQVFIPDFFDGAAADISWYPPDTPEKGEKLGHFFQTKAQPPAALARLPKILDSLQASHGVEEWAAIGYCWGGKIVNLSSAKDTRFKVAAACHPAMVSPEDAENVSIPYAMLPSKDESKDDVDKWEQKIKTEHVVEWFPTQVHGWMAARADLEDDEVKKEYERGYQLVLDFFAKHW